MKSSSRPSSSGSPSRSRGMPFVLMLPIMVISFTALTAWGHRYGYVLGSPWVIGVLVAVFTAAGHERFQRVLGGGHLHNRLVLRLVIALGIPAALVSCAGWGFMLPAVAVLIAVVHMGWSGSASWRTSALATGIATVLTQGALHLSIIPSILPTGLSDLIAAWNFLLALAALSNLGGAAAKAEQATGALRRTEARFRSLVERSSDVITIIDADARLLDASPAMRYVTGWDPDQLLGTDRFLLLHPEDQPAARAALAQVVAGGDGSEQRVDVRSAHRDGTWRWHEICLRNLIADPAVGGVVGHERDISDRRVYQDHLAHTAAHDGLTGLPNRTEVLRVLAGAVRRTAPGNLVALLFIDLDGFKLVNDTYGHQVGDALLVAVTDRLRTEVRPGDVLGRLGGDEFAIILTGVHDREAVQAKADELMAVMLAPFHLDACGVRIGASIGVAWTDDPTSDAAALISRADARMYEVKRGRPDRPADLRVG